VDKLGKVRKLLQEMVSGIEFDDKYHARAAMLVDGTAKAIVETLACDCTCKGGDDSCGQ